jgi:hypothetical protein
MSDETIVTKANSSSTENPPATKTLVGRRNRISIASAVLLGSFFLPWIKFFGANISGLDIQKNFSSYKYVWLLPVFAALTFILNISGVGTDLMRRVAGIVPFTILIYSVHRFGSDLWSSILIGGWLALVSGIGLLVIPNEPKPQPEL